MLQTETFSETMKLFPPISGFHEQHFRQIKYPKHPLHYLLPPVKVSHSQMVLRPTYPYQIPLAKISRRGRDFVRIVFPRSSSYAAYSSCLGLLYILEYLIVRLVLLLLLFNCNALYHFNRCGCI